MRLKQLREIVFVGLGLHDELGISLRGLEEIKAADAIFIELYTNLMPGFSPERFEAIAGKRLQLMTRRELEEENGETVFKAAETGKVVVLVPGDPLVATTHVALRIGAKKRGIKTRIVHGASIISAAIGLSGLHNYKFGKSVTIPFPDETPSGTPYAVIARNKRLGLHTLCLLDIKIEEKRYLTIREALEALLEIENNRKEGAFDLDTLAVGIARAGSDCPTVKAGSVRDLLTRDYGGPPYTLVIPGELHFMEAEALVAFADAPKALRGTKR